MFCLADKSVGVVDIIIVRVESGDDSRFHANVDFNKVGIHYHSVFGVSEVEMFRSAGSVIPDALHILITEFFKKFACLPDTFLLGKFHFSASPVSVEHNEFAADFGYLRVNFSALGHRSDVVTDYFAVFGHTHNDRLEFAVFREYLVESFRRTRFVDFFARKTFYLSIVHAVGKRSVVNHFGIIDRAFFKIVELRDYKVVGVVVLKQIEVVFFVHPCRQSCESLF